METKKDLRKIHISLDKEAYKVLKQKSSYSGLSMNAYLKKIALDVNITTYTIVVHDLSEKHFSICNVELLVISGHVEDYILCPFYVLSYLHYHNPL